MTDSVFEETRKSIHHGEDIVVVSIVKTEGSSPGKVGCRMLVRENGKTYGTIGGGDLELFCTKAALDVYKTRKTYTRDFCLDNKKQDDVSMICGGNVSVEFRFIECAKGESELEKLFNLNATKPRVLIFGGGHVGTELCPVLEHVGFRVFVLDDRPEYASKERHQKAEKCILCNYGNISENIEINKDDYVVVMTHGHSADREVLLQVSKSNPFYIGCIGSRKKVVATHEYLRENGISEDIIQSVHSPIGLPIGGDSPAEIAISITAQIIQRRYASEK